MLLNIFYLYRLDALDEYHDGSPKFSLGGQRWWYKLTHVCGWWRYLIFGSPSQLGLHLLCTRGVSIAKMLAHFPSLPLTIYYHEYVYKTSEEDEEDILLALRHSDRVHYITLCLLPTKLRKIMATMDEQFPILERLILWPGTKGDGSVVLPRTFQAPHLCHLNLWTAALPIRSPLLTTTEGLISLRLNYIPASTYFPPTYLLTQLSLVPQLEILEIQFHSPLPNCDVKRQLQATPIMPHITLPNLRQFAFRGVSTYLEGLLPQISAQVLSKLEIELFNQLSFTVPHLLQFLGASETLSFNTVHLTFNSYFACLSAFQLGEMRRYPFYVNIMCRHLEWQVLSAAQILHTLQPVLSVMKTLTLIHAQYNRLSEWDNKVDRTQWRQLLRPFTNLKMLYVQNELIERLAPSLQSDNGDPLLKFLPNLEEVGYSGGEDALKAFTPFLNEQQVAGHPVNLTPADPSEIWPY